MVMGQGPSPLAKRIDPSPEDADCSPGQLPSAYGIRLCGGADTFEADGVIISTPAPQAYGVLQTASDETNALKIIREIDEIYYEPCYTLMAGYGDREPPEWQGVQCNKSPLSFISNESTKRETNQECTLVVKTTPAFTRSLWNKKDEELIKREILAQLGIVIGGWAATPQWSQLHYWKHMRAIKVLNRPFMELEFEDAPLALTGDYFTGNTLDHAYRSGIKLAKTWVEKYS